MSFTPNVQTNDSLSVLLQKAKAVITVNDESMCFILSRMGQDVILKYHYEIETNKSSSFKIRNTKIQRNTTLTCENLGIQLNITKRTKPVNDIIDSWTYKGEGMTKEVIAFHDFINLTFNNFEDLLRLHEDYVVLYDRYSRVLVDEPESIATVLGLLRNVERVQVAIGQIHGQIIDTREKTQEEKEEILREYIRKNRLRNLKLNAPDEQLNFIGRSEEFGTSFSKATIDGASKFAQTVHSYVIDNKRYLAYEGREKHNIVLWDVANKCVSGTLTGHQDLIGSLVTYEKDKKSFLPVEVKIKQ